MNRPDADGRRVIGTVLVGPRCGAALLARIRGMMPSGDESYCNNST